jgi:hypothetical protein
MGRTAICSNTSLASIINRKRVSLDIELQGVGVTQLGKRASDISFNIVKCAASGYEVWF